MPPIARLQFSDSEHHADMVYATGLFVPDPFLWCQVGEERAVVVSPLEFGRFTAQAPRGTRVLSYDQAKTLCRLRDFRASSQILGVSRLFDVKRWEVPADFPLGLARQVARRGVSLVPASGAFFPEREFKQAREIELVREGVRLAEAGLQRALEILAAASIKGDSLIWEGTPLTVERLRGEMDATVCRRGGQASHTICAPGPQGADPHQGGFGPIAPHQPIVLDIFPRVSASGYFGDLTRTVVKGQASPIVRQAWEAVRAARDAAKAMIRPGVNGKAVHEEVTRQLEAANFVTDLNANPPRGFFHGTGHGLGLEIHEAPRVSRVDQELRVGHIVTVEPGVYYPEWGGMRLEDVVVLTETGNECLTVIPDQLEIP
jgi:Xaa-Pro aminopeptidase